MITTVFFDIDDTLCDRSGVLLRCLTTVWELLEKKHPSIFVCKEFIQEYKTHAQKYLSREETFHLVLRSKGIDDRDTAIQMSREYEAYMDRELKLFDGALEVLSLLKKTFTLGVISNAPARSQREKIEKLDIQSFFKYVVISSEVGSAKPDSAIFQTALRLARAEAHESVYVGNDPRLDVDGAKGAGLVTVWANMHSSNYTGLTVPDFEIHTLRELARILTSE
jgi:putative hydrolase of the HAD superfamily